MLPDEKKTTICGFCSQGCELTMQFEAGPDPGLGSRRRGSRQPRTSLRPGPLPCPRGGLSSQRVLKPLVRKDGRLVETCLGRSLGRRRQKGWPLTPPRDIAVFGSAQEPCEDLFLLRKFAREGLKTHQRRRREAFSAQARLLDTAAEQGFAPRLNYRIYRHLQVPGHPSLRQLPADGRARDSSGRQERSQAHRRRGEGIARHPLRFGLAQDPGRERSPIS